MTRLARIALALTSGVLYALAEPPHDWAVLGFVALVPLLLAAADSPSTAGALGLGWVTGTTGATLLVASSVAEAATRYFGAGSATAIAAGALAPQLYAAPYFAAFAALARALAQRRREPVVVALGVAAAWVACELARARVGDGCPWVLLAHTQHAHPVWLQAAELGGASTVSFVLAFASACAATALRTARGVGRERATQLARLGGAALLVVGGAWLYGHARLARWSDLEGFPSVRVAVVQPSLPEEWRRSLAHVRDGVTRLRALTEETRAARPQLVVWPENAISVSPDAIRMLAREGGVVPPGATLLVGAPRAVQSAPGRAVLHNAAHVVDDSGASRAVYDKRVLTPWAETAPWPLSWLPGAWPAAPGDYTAGSPSDGLPQVDGHAFGVTICSEAVHAALVRTQVRDGATFLVNLANDAWFGDEPAAAQHAAAALLRAVESRRALVRGTTSGISMVVQPSGHVVARAPVGAATALVADVPVVDVATPYTRAGDAFAWACVALAAGILLLPARRR